MSDVCEKESILMEILKYTGLNYVEREALVLRFISLITSKLEFKLSTEDKFLKSYRDLCLLFDHVLNGCKKSGDIKLNTTVPLEVYYLEYAESDITFLEIFTLKEFIDECSKFLESKRIQGSISYKISGLNTESVYQIPVSDIFDTEFIKQFRKAFGRLVYLTQMSAEQTHTLLEKWLTEHVMKFYKNKLIDKKQTDAILEMAEQLDKLEIKKEVMGAVPLNMLRILLDEVNVSNSLFKFNTLLDLMEKPESKIATIKEPLSNGTVVVIKEPHMKGEMVKGKIVGILPEYLNKSASTVYAVEVENEDYKIRFIERFNIAVDVK